METNDVDASARLAAEVLIAYVQHNAVPATELPELARRLSEAFAGGAAPSSRRASASAWSPRPNPEPAAAARPSSRPAVPIDESVHDDYLVSLEDGKHYRSLRRHLMAKYGMTPDDYRSKWGLPPDYPMVAPSYARDRSEVAKRSGLGLSPAKAKDARRA